MKLRFNSPAELDLGKIGRHIESYMCPSTSGKYSSVSILIGTDLSLVLTRDDIVTLAAYFAVTVDEIAEKNSL